VPAKDRPAPRVEGLVLVLVVVLGLGLGLGGCATIRPVSNATPTIVIRPGVPERIALMDQYRLGDDIRKRMMARPHVWVEEVPEDEAQETQETQEPQETVPSQTSE
jgi:hypothetical protein